ncbi:WYL domain-containing protein [Streptomyces sp. LamerLS-316]|nr:WYL domain-containing protein [Streptomyces sp. SID4921]SCK46727.1 WYL domain-containing protein [Streptomyces sp. LamerLS-316]
MRASRLVTLLLLPAELREHAERIQQRFLLDAPGWYGDADRTPHLTAAAAAVWARRAVVLRYRRWRAPEEIERRVKPYGLVLKAGRWYLEGCLGQSRFPYDLELIAGPERNPAPSPRPSVYAAAPPDHLSRGDRDRTRPG